MKKKKELKPFKLDGEEYATICHQGYVGGPLVIDINMDSLTPPEARKLAKWLNSAADEVEESRKRK